MHNDRSVVFEGNMKTNPPIQDDPVLVALDEAFAALQKFRDVYTRQKKVTEYEFERLREGLRGGHAANRLTVEQVAQRFSVKPGTVREGVGKFWCLYKAKYKPGQRLLFPLVAIEAHERNIMERGECGVCFKAVKPKK
jgi:hypothetical protein